MTQAVCVFGSWKLQVNSVPISATVCQGVSFLCIHYGQHNCIQDAREFFKDLQVICGKYHIKSVFMSVLLIRSVEFIFLSHQYTRMTAT